MAPAIASAVTPQIIPPNIGVAIVTCIMLPWSAPAE